MSNYSQNSAARLLLASVVGLSVTVLLVGCGGQEDETVNASSSQYEVADDDPADAQPAPAPTADMAPVFQPADASPPTGSGEPGGTQVPSPPTLPPMDDGPADAAFQVPDGEAELLAFLESLQARQPQARSQQEFMAELGKMSETQLAAADKLLATTAKEEVRFTATQAKLDAMRMLARVSNNPQAAKQLHAYCREVMTNENEKIALLGRLVLFGLAVDDLVMGQVQNVQPILDELKALVSEHADAPGVFRIVAQAARTLQGIGDQPAANEAFQAIIGAYKNSEDPQVASEARSLELNTKLPALMAGEPGALEAVMANIKELLGGNILNQTVLNMTSQVGQLLEMTGNYEQAGEVFTMIEQAYQGNEVPALAQQATDRAANGRKRAALVGEPFVVEGVQVDDAPFDWTQYQGKVVLVDFWATWCGPCLQEIPNIIDAYQKWNSKGFEVVGVNLDEDVRTVQQFLGPQPLPWSTVVSQNPAERGFNSPMAVKCGVDAIPFIVLVNQEGNVEALHLRGEQLHEKLTEMLGPPAETTPAATGGQTGPGVQPAPAVPTAPADGAGGNGAAAEDEGDSSAATAPPLPSPPQ